MFVDDIFDKNSDDIKLAVRGNKSTYGIIQKYFNKDRNQHIYSIKYFYKNVYQDTVYENELENAKIRLKNILSQIHLKKNKIKTFEQFSFPDEDLYENSI